MQVVEYEDPGGDSSTVLWVGDHVLSVYLQQGAALACPSGNLGMTLPRLSRESHVTALCICGPE